MDNMIPLFDLAADLARAAFPTPTRPVSAIPPMGERARENTSVPNVGETRAHVTLYQSVDGLAAEVTGIPIFEGPDWMRHRRQQAYGAAVLCAQYPQLRVRRSESAGSDTFLYWLEAI